LLSTKVCELPVVSSVVFELLAESSFFEQEMMVKLKRNMEKMMSRCFTWFPIGGYRRTQYITSIGLFYKEVGFYFEGSEYGS
jgi:hypothetical protein